MKEAPGSSETPVLTRATRRNILEDTILHSHRRENLKSYIVLTYYDTLNRSSWTYISNAHMLVMQSSELRVTLSD
jgi:hypothetical protein